MQLLPAAVFARWPAIFLCCVIEHHAMPGLSGPNQRGKGWTSNSKPKKKQGRRAGKAPKRSVLDVQRSGNLSLAAISQGIPEPEEPSILEQLETVGGKVSDAAEAAVDKLKDLFLGDDK